MVSEFTHCVIAFWLFLSARRKRLTVHAARTQSSSKPYRLEGSRGSGTRSTFVTSHA